MVTNDGNAILREIMVKHPAAKSMIEISRTQDEECGDGTTSVIILGRTRAFYGEDPDTTYFCGIRLQTSESEESRTKISMFFKSKVSMKNGTYNFVLFW